MNDSNIEIEMVSIDEMLRVVKEALEPFWLPVLLGNCDWLEVDDDPVLEGWSIICFAGLFRANRENIAPWTGRAWKPTFSAVCML